MKWLMDVADDVSEDSDENALGKGVLASGFAVVKDLNGLLDSIFTGVLRKWVDAETEWVVRSVGVVPVFKGVPAVRLDVVHPDC
mgnify:CR=1 FL=1